jgi:dynactin 1
MVREKADETLDIPESTLWEASLKILKSLTSELANTLTGVENDHKKDKSKWSCGLILTLFYC